MLLSTLLLRNSQTLFPVICANLHHVVADQATEMLPFIQTRENVFLIPMSLDTTFFFILNNIFLLSWQTIEKKED